MIRFFGFYFFAPIYFFSMPLFASEYLIKLKAGVDLLDLTHLKAQPVIDQIWLVQASEFYLIHLHHRGLIEHFEPNHELETQVVPNDLSRTLWGLNNLREPGVDIGALNIWPVTTGSRDIVVAVIDTGIDLRHPDIMDNLWVNQVEFEGVPHVDDDENGYVDDIHGYHFAANHGSPQDQRGHGTHVAGTIGAVGNNGRGLVGVAWSVQLMALNMFPRYSNAKVSDALRAMKYAIDQGAHIVNASFAATEDLPEDEVVLLKEGIQMLDDAGILVVAAAGNHSSNNDLKPTWPANFEFDNVISVGSIDQRGNLSRFSNYGQNTVHVLAPGSEIQSLEPGGRLGYKSGTSMSAPHVTGMAVLLLSEQPDLTPLHLKTKLMQMCQLRPGLTSVVQCGGFTRFN